MLPSRHAIRLGAEVEGAASRAYRASTASRACRSTGCVRAVLAAPAPRTWRRGSASRSSRRSLPPRASPRFPPATGHSSRRPGSAAVRSSSPSLRAASAPSMSGSRRSISIDVRRVLGRERDPICARRRLERSEPGRARGRPERASGSRRCRRRSARWAPAYPPAMAIRLVLADDHLIVREGVQRLLDTQPGIEVVGRVRRPRLPVGRGGCTRAGGRRHGHPHAAGQHRRRHPGRRAAARDRIPMSASSCSASTPRRATPSRCWRAGARVARIS